MIIYLSLNIYKIIIIFFGIEFCWISWGKVREAISLRRRLNWMDWQPARWWRRLRRLRSSRGSLISRLLTPVAPLLWFCRNTRRLRLWRLQWWSFPLIFFFFFKIFLLIPNIKKKKKPYAKQHRLVGLTATVTEAVTEPWIDKNWKLEDWIDKTES